MVPQWRGDSPMTDFTRILGSNATITLRGLSEQSRLLPWHPGMAIVAEGEFLIIGVSIASVYDLRLLNAMNDALESERVHQVSVAVFDWTSLRPDALAPDVPHLGEPSVTP